MQIHNICFRWSPGYTGTEGNETADRMADLMASQLPHDEGPASQPTISGISSISRSMRDEARDAWWLTNSTKMSRACKQWGTSYRLHPIPEPTLTRPTLHRLLAIRTTHGDFS
ncbi:putative membrane protein [Venturia inaequalis]|nr:putative membrane protein [Venturia inaequalis]